jgi:hypothetical protein
MIFGERGEKFVALKSSAVVLEALHGSPSLRKGGGSKLQDAVDDGGKKYISMKNSVTAK